MAGFHVYETSWQEDEAALRMIRQTVFINGQNVSEEEEWDGLDEQARHLLIAKDDQALACARIVEEGDALHLGRVAVLEIWRGQGLGKSLVNTAIKIAAEEGYQFLVLDAQSYALEFYISFGFHVEGDEFMDAGIPHRHMRLVL